MALFSVSLYGVAVPSHPIFLGGLAHLASCSHSAIRHAKDCAIAIALPDSSSGNWSKPKGFFGPSINKAGVAKMVVRGSRKGLEVISKPTRPS
jgi:hypothetical protein